MNHGFTQKNMIFRIKKFTDDEILYLECQKTAYSNYVYLFATKSGVFMYKEYIENAGIVDKTEELKIQLQIGFPKILLFESNYRIELFADSTPVCFVNDLAQIAESLKKFHDMPIECKNTQASMLEKILEKQRFENVESTYTTDTIESIKNDNVEIMNVLRNKDKFLSYKSKSKKRNSEIALFQRIKNLVLDKIHTDDMCFCHNDLQIGNMMKKDAKVEFIDFEYASFGNRYVDIANFFCETMCDYSTSFKLNKELGLTTKEKLYFLSKYDPHKVPEDILAIVESLTCFSHFYWYLWARFMHQNGCGPSNTFNYRIYAMSRLDFLHESKIIDEKDKQLLEF